jgi:lipoprotein-anchoring transpeptidase ErfK/SrfK
MRIVRNRKRCLAPLGAVALLGGLSGCGGPAHQPAGTMPVATVASSIAPGARNVGISAPLVVMAQHGTLREVTVTVSGGSAGQTLAGTFSPDRSRWISGPLSYGTEYTATATATATATGPGTGTKPATLTSTFRTVTPAHKLTVLSVRPSGGSVVGVAMPISINFTQPVTDRAAVERALRVTPSIPTEGSFHWITNQRVDWRPRNFWAAGTTVRVDVPLRGVAAGRDTFGMSDYNWTFGIGAAHEAIGDAARHTLTLLENGRPVRTLPASFGQPKYQTHSGLHVAMQKHLIKEMRSDSWPGGPKEGEPGFYDVKEPLAVRISNNGEFVHVNNLTVAQQGRSNVSHGCVNLSMANGRIFFNWVQIGDPVNIVNTSVPLSASEGDISSWLYSWDDYRAGSAVRGSTGTQLPPLPGMPPGFTAQKADTAPTLFPGIPNPAA